MRKISWTLALAAIGGVALSGAAHADAIFTASGTAGGNAVAASADFAISGNLLMITLANTSPANALEAPTNTLTGISFTLNGGTPKLTPLLAISPNAIIDAAGCTGSLCSGTNVNVGGEWGYQRNYGGAEGISSSGYVTTGLAGDIGNFNNGAAGTNLAGPNSLDGINFGILSNSHGALNTGLGVPLIQNDVILTLSGVYGFTTSQIGNVTFLYGTSPDATLPGVLSTPIPEPGSLVLFCTALLGAGLLAGRRRTI